MEQNIQNTSTNDENIKILLNSKNAPNAVVLTIAGDKMKELGLDLPVLEGWGYTSTGSPFCAGAVFNHNICEQLSMRIERILTASIVNSEQRKAVMDLIEQSIYGVYNDETSRIRYHLTNYTPEEASGDNGIIIERL